MSIQKYIDILKNHISKDYRNMFREPSGLLRHSFIVPGSSSYSDILWDWDSWLSNIALRQVLLNADDNESEKAIEYERGCILNFLDFTDHRGWMPIAVSSQFQDIHDISPENPYVTNMHKPVIAQHAAFLVRQAGGNAEWLRSRFEKIQFFHNTYRNHFRHHPTGLFFWADDLAIGVDNDPSTFYRPKFSSASIYLNALMYRELLASAYLAKQLNLLSIGQHYLDDAQSLKDSIQRHCYDRWTKFFYSCDLNLLPLRSNESMPQPHVGSPRHWDCLLMRIGIWSGFLAMWSEVATPEQADAIVKLHYRNKDSFNAPFGVRTLSQYEPMYNIRASGNPSNWCGPIWGISNYMVWRGLKKYGFENEATELAEKTIVLFGRDIERFDALHEYYDPENGEPILNRGFQNWNYLVLNMIASLENKPAIFEF